MLDGDDGSLGSPEIHTNGDHAPATQEISLEEDADDVPLGNDPPSKLRIETSEPPTPKTFQQSPVENGSYRMDISIVEFEKRGEGMNAYIVYKIVTEVHGVAGYNLESFQVWRRFSDFLGLHEKLVEKYLPKGLIVPAPPEKSIAALTRTKASSESTAREVATIRCRLLQRFLRRLSQHPSMRSDCDLRDFLTLAADLPRATNTAALSSAGVKRMLKSVGEAFSKIAIHMEEGDRWFEQAQSQMDELDEGTRRMHSISQTLANTRKELASHGELFCKALSMLSSCEESTALARCLSHLTEAEEGVTNTWEKQSVSDTTELVECLGEYVSLLNSLKNVFAERHRVWNNWQNAQQNITKKREQKTRLELAGKAEKAAALREETEEAVQRADELEAQFGKLSEQIKEEVARFEAIRKKEMRQMLIVFLESLIETHQEMFQLWRRFAPETDIV